MSTIIESAPKADALGFLAPQGQPPFAIEDLPQHVDLLHVTAAPPFFPTTDQVLNGAVTPDGQRELPGVRMFRQLIEQQPQLKVIAGQSEVHEALSAGRTAIILGLQHTPQDIDETGLKDLFKAGVRVMALEYKNGGQRYGSGWLDSEGPLTDDGKTLLNGMADAGFILDVSHSGEHTASDALKFIEDEDLPLPVIASHGGIREAYAGDSSDINNRRNLSLETLERVKQRGGVVGIYALTFGLSGHDNSETPFLNHLHRAAELFPDNSVIGTDAVYATRDLDEWEQTFGFMMRNVASGTDMEPRYPDTPFELNSEARLTTIGNRLITDGMAEWQAAQLVGSTLVDFFLRSLPA